MAAVESLSETVAKHLAEKYDPELEQQVRTWIAGTLQSPPSTGPLQEELKSGVRLCKLLNAISPGAVAHVYEGPLAFKQIENIANFLDACGRLGLSERNRFQTLDLFEEKDMCQVLVTLRHLARVASELPTYRGPRWEGGGGPSCSLAGKRGSVEASSPRGCPPSGRRGSGEAFSPRGPLAGSPRGPPVGSPRGPLSGSPRGANSPRGPLAGSPRGPPNGRRGSVGAGSPRGPPYGGRGSVGASSPRAAGGRGRGAPPAGRGQAGPPRGRGQGPPRGRGAPGARGALPGAARGGPGRGGAPRGRGGAPPRGRGAPRGRGGAPGVAHAPERSEPVAPAPVEAPAPAAAPTPAAASTPTPAGPTRATGASQLPKIGEEKATGEERDSKVIPFNATPNWGAPSQSPGPTRANRSSSASARKKRWTIVKSQSYGAKRASGTASVSSLDNDIKTKEMFKYDPAVERAVLQWIEACIGEKNMEASLHDFLKSGVVLCRLLNTLKPGTIGKIETSNISFKQRENIANYLRGCEDAFGLATSSLFQTIDLYEEKNMNQVMTSVTVLAREAARIPGYNGPVMNAPTKSDNPLYSAAIVSGLQEIVEEEAASTEEKELIVWVNSHLSAYNMTIERVRSGLRNGVKLVKLLEHLSGATFGEHYEKSPANMWHCMQNATLVLVFIHEQSGEKVKVCTGHDVMLANLQPMMALLKVIRKHFDREFVFKSQNLTVDSCRIKILEELRQTEETYVGLLDVIDTEILQVIERDGLLPTEEVPKIFSNLGAIVAFNRLVLEALRTATALDPTVGIVSDIFIKEEFIPLYSTYVNNFDMASLMLKYNKKKYKPFKKLIKAFEAKQAENSGLEMQSFLILPVQRLPRYMLLLKELLKYTPEAHPDHDGIGAAMTFLGNALDTINENKRVAEQSTFKMLSIDKSIVYDLEGFDGIVHPLRQYSYEGILHWDEMDEEESPYWFLFTDIMVMCAILPPEQARGDKQFQYVTLLPLKFCEEIKDSEEDEATFVMVIDEEDMFFKAESKEEKEKWKQHIKDALALKVDLDLVW